MLEESIDLADYRFLVGVSRYFARDIEGSATLLLAALERLQGALPTAEFDTPEKTGAYIAAGLVLFLLTFAVNSNARTIINRRKEFTE